MMRLLPLHKTNGAVLVLMILHIIYMYAPGNMQPRDPVSPSYLWEPTTDQMSNVSTTVKPKSQLSPNLNITTNSRNHSSEYLLCGRFIPVPYSTRSKPSPVMSPPPQDKLVVVIGHDKMNHVQTNNHINAIFHAMDYAIDVNATLGIVENGWAIRALERLFRQDEKQMPYGAWIEQLEGALDLFIVKEFSVADNTSEIELSRSGLSRSVTEIKSGDEMYYYNTNASMFEIQRRREEVLTFLWTHPTRSSKVLKDMCLAVEYHHHSHHPLFSSLPTKYAVIHSRWMKHDACLKRMRRFARRVHGQTGIRMDDSAPCLLEPSYIDRILDKFQSNTNGVEQLQLDMPIYVISDGLNPNIIAKLKQHPRFGPNVYAVPPNVSWVGSDMMLGVLADVFIGTPVSTLSGNIARARVALGFRPDTNFLFPKECDHRSQSYQKTEEESECDWEFSCQGYDYGGAVDCLYDKRILKHYVG